ncbi:hypothetical protein [Coralloluteibacterium thermophilus]|uniref:DUF423 domain-containing protein n=1 Tax=Coralloluteibacterium thermophilum TaxID=2707049 RepID=A0ABV9NJY0_9GAMM
MTLELARALREGSTRPTMAGLVVASLFQGLAMAAGPVGWLEGARLTALGYVAAPAGWAALHFGSALLMGWRLLDRNSRPWCAWLSNGLMCLVWVLTYLGPAVLLSDANALGSPLVVLPLGAMWVLMRTGATPRDRRQA